jgi:hypothetical protein
MKRKTTTYDDPGKNIDPAMNTAPESSMYQQFENSPVLEYNKN